MNCKIASLLWMLAVLEVIPGSLFAQEDRIAGRIDRLKAATLRGNIHPSARPEFDAGRLDPSAKMDRVMLMFRRSDAQQAALNLLLAEQQERSSKNYHNWLTPDQFGERFGLSVSDIAKVSSWLQSEGLAVDEVSHGRNWVWFSGAAGQIETALRIHLHRYRIDGELHYANAEEPSVPTSIEPLVAGILGLDDFRPKAHKYAMRPLYTDASGRHSLAPNDFATIYDLNPFYKSGFDGTGQRIVVIGQSDVVLSDIQLFRSTYGLPPNDPQIITPASGGFIGVNSAEIEGDLDLEWAGAVARNATILYLPSDNVLTGGVPYAIDHNLAPIITYSFAGCEQRYSPATRTSTQEYAQQANAQGITWVAGSGDSGAAGCDTFGNPNHLAASLGVAVSFPVSLPEVTGVGGTQFSEGAGAYWNTSNSNNSASALSYIPETSWNESGAIGLLGGGGGLSVEYARPPWQTGPGLPGWNGRAVPDVSLAAGVGDGYRIVHGGISGVVGGTSAGAPSFAGMLALANQYQIANGVQTQSGQGNINPGLYRLAQTSPNVFHDITSGGNVVPCVAGTPDCSIGVLGYPAGPGYDLATGLGSVDGYNLALGLATQWNDPAIGSLSPQSVIASGEAFTLAVIGSGFDAGTIVKWNGRALPTTFVSSTQLRAIVDKSLITAPQSAAITVLSARGESAPSPLGIVPSPGATFDSQRVTLFSPPISGCVVPPATNSFSTFNSVYLFFNANTTASDSLTSDWLSPNLEVTSGSSWPDPSGISCFNGRQLQGAMDGIWQARVFDQGSLLFSVSFGLNTPILSPFPADGQSFNSDGGNETININFPAGFLWSAASSADWITFPGSVSGIGNGTLNYQLAPNPGADSSATITVAGFTFNIKQEATAIPGSSFIGSMAHVAAEENWTTVFTLVNKSMVPAAARLSFFGDGAGPTANEPLMLPLMFPDQYSDPGPILAASFDQTLGANESLIVDTAGSQKPPVLVGSAQLAGNGAVDGFAIFHQVTTGQEAVVPMETRNASSYLLAFDNTNGVVLGVAVENVSSVTASIPVVIRDDTGSVLSSPGTSISIAANGHTSFVLSDPLQGFPVTAHKRGTVEFDTPGGGNISVLGIRFTPPNNALTTIPAFANVGTGGGSIAHLASGGDGWQTTFVLVNTGTRSAPATLSFFADATGAPLPLPLSFPQGNRPPATATSITQTMPAGSTFLVQSSGAPQLLTGSAQLSTTGNVSGFVIFRHNNQEAVVPLESRDANAYILAFDNTNGNATGVALNNISTQPVDIGVIVRSHDGTQLETDTITLPAHGHYAFTLAVDKYWYAGNNRGTIEFAKPANGQIGVLGIRIPPTQTYTTLPALAR
jgi:hypothetical protein